MVEDGGSDLLRLFKKSEENDSIFTIGTTVDTGLEWQAVDECREKINSAIRVVKRRGKIYFNISLEEFSKVQNLRSVDNIFIMADVRNFDFTTDDKDADLTSILNAVQRDMKLEKTLSAWKTVTKFPGKIYPTIDEFQSAEKGHRAEKERQIKEEERIEKEKQTLETEQQIEGEKLNSTKIPNGKQNECSVKNKGRKRGRDPSLGMEENVLKYRVTCERTGVHSFQSGEVARIIGGELQDKFHWLVDLTMFHLEVVCNVIDKELVMGLRVTHESKHRRNIVHFGPTTLRATVCYNLMRLAHPKPGEIIIDPMCGGGSIPIEAAMAHTRSFVLCGDNHEKAVGRTKANIDALPVREKMDLVRWSVSNLPLQDSYVDVFVTDMPFGKRSGSMTDNRVLYKKYILEMGRVVKRGTGRLVLLTYDRRSIYLALQAAGDLFRVTKMLGVNMGGLHAAVYVLKRSNIPHDQVTPKSANSTEKSKAESTRVERTTLKPCPLPT